MDIGPDSIDAGSSDADWIADLQAGGGTGVLAARRVHQLLLGATRRQVARLLCGLPDIDAGCVEELAGQAANDALGTLLRRLDTFEGTSSFATWIYKFGVRYASATVHRHAFWRRPTPGRVGPDRFGRPGAEDQHVVGAEVVDAVRTAMEQVLTAHQRRVVMALIVQRVPVDVVAELLDTTRNTLYRTLHDARQQLRTVLAEDDLLPRRCGGRAR